MTESKPLPAKRRYLQKLLHESLYWPADRLRELQWQKMESLIRHAYDSTEYYRNRLESLRLDPRVDFRDIECWQKLPMLEKHDIQRFAKQMQTRSPSVTGVVSNSTGGSTGVPLNFYQDDNYVLWADVARSRAWRHFDGVSPRAIEAVLWGAVQDVGRGESLRSLIVNLVRYRTFALNTFDLDEVALRKFFRLLKLLRPQILRGYASSLYFVAKYIEANGIILPRPKVIVSTAETLWPAMREKVTTVFGADVIDSYGCREVSQIATECSCHCGLHIVMENQFIEIEDGNILVTNLNNLAMPFIRYRVGDLAERIDTDCCACGRSAHRLMGLKGRDNDYIELSCGKTINAIFFQYLFFGYRTVEQFQVVYSRCDQQLRIRLRVTNRSENLDEIIVDKIAELFDFHNVKVEYVDTISSTPSGKFRFVYSVDRFEDCLVSNTI